MDMMNMANMTKFYQVSHNKGQDAKIIIAHTEYEALGYYLKEEIKDISAKSLDRVKMLGPSHEVEVSYNGVLVKKRLWEIWEEKNTWNIPYLVF